MDVQEVQQTWVIGIHVRTKNDDEMNRETARIGNLWKRFQEEQLFDKIPGKKQDDRIYVVYTAYESDALGHYSLIIGAAVEEGTEVPEGMLLVSIPGGNYARFLAIGDMPDALIEAWKSIWYTFEQPIEYRRNFKTDFELHDPSTPTKVEVYVGVFK